MATLVVPPNLSSPRDDAMALYRAFKGLGCDTAAVVSILSHRDGAQRAMIQQEYKTMYSEDLIKRLTSELSSHLERAILLWMHEPAARDAFIVWEAFTANDMKVVAEVICSRTPTQIQVFMQIYYSRYGARLEQVIESQVNGDVQKLLHAYVTTRRYEGYEVDRMAADKDAKALFKAGEKKLGTDEKTFNRIFSTSSSAHLAAVSSAYHNMYGNSLEKAIKKETSGLYEFALLTILRCAESSPMYFAKALHKAMKGMGTNDSTLIRIVVTRTEIDMHYIKDAYHKKYKKYLSEAIKSETSSHYRNFLLSLIGPH